VHPHAAFREEMARPCTRHTVRIPHAACFHCAPGLRPGDAEYTLRITGFLRRGKDLGWYKMQPYTQCRICRAADARSLMLRRFHKYYSI
jgi:hypothetical protein